MTLTPKPILNPDLRRLSDAIVLGLRMMEDGARGSGRTTRMLERVTPEHCVIVTTQQEGRHMAAEMKRQGLGVKAILSVDPRKPLFDPSNGVIHSGCRPTLPDHTWVSARLQALIEDAVAQVQYELDQVDRPMTPEEIRAQRANYLVREAMPKHRRPHFDFRGGGRD